MRFLRKSSIFNKTRKSGLSQTIIVVLVVLTLSASVVVIYVSQMLVERDVISIASSIDNATPKEQYEIVKLRAEVQQILSNISGSLFWLKLIALFVTVGGAVGGYLIGQSQMTRARIDFEDRKSVDAAYQSIVQELSDESPLLRAAAAVKLGMILKSFPYEWNVSDDRCSQLIELTKQVLATSLSIETETKVLKTLTIAIVLHHPWKDDANAGDKVKYGDLRGIDLSGARAYDAYWARVDFTYADFYRADLAQTSFRNAILRGAQFREANLKNAVLINAECEGANFKLADLRNADLSEASLVEANFEDAKVYGLVADNAIFAKNPKTLVDNSPDGDGTMVISFQEWLSLYKQGADKPS
jgi:hypothetical protein